MTQAEYEQKKRECWEEFWDEISGNIDFAPGVDDRMKEHIYDTFDRAYALGKQENDADTVISGWVARDEDGSLTLFYGSDKPSKKDNDDYWSAVFGNTLEYLPQEMFPDIKWEDAEPTKVEIIIKRKKK